MPRPTCLYKCDCARFCQPYLFNHRLPPGLRLVTGGTWYAHQPYRTADSAAYIAKITARNPQGERHVPKFHRKRQFPPKTPTTIPPKKRKRNPSGDVVSAHNVARLPILTHILCFHSSARISQDSHSSVHSRASSPDVDMVDADAGSNADPADASFADASGARSTPSPAPPRVSCIPHDKITNIHVYIVPWVWSPPPLGIPLRA